MRTRWSLCSAVLAVVLCAGLVQATAAPPAALATPMAQRQVSTSTSLPGGASSGPATTTANLLQGTTTTSATTTTPSDTRSPSSRVADDNRRVWLVVAGLVLVAVLLALLTAWYWVRTQPARVVETIGPPPTDRRRPARAAPTARERDQGATAVTRAGRDRVRPERVEPSDVRRPVRPQRSQREAALRRARDLSR